jgi:hypothetical protein
MSKRRTKKQSKAQQELAKANVAYQKLADSHAEEIALLKAAISNAEQEICWLRQIISGTTAARSGRPETIHEVMRQVERPRLINRSIPITFRIPQNGFLDLTQVGVGVTVKKES